MASLVERLELLITANAKGAIAGIKETELATAELNAETSKSSKLFASMGTYAKVGAGLAAVAITAMAVKGVEDFVNLTGQVRAYQRILGGTAEENSRLAASTRALGVDSDLAVRGFGLLAKNIGNGTDTLRQWGVTIAQTKTGQTDLIATLGNIADKYKEIQDPSQKAAFLAQNFGRSYQTLIPLLSKSREELKAFGDEADKNHEVFNQSQLDQGRDYAVTMRELKMAVQGLALALGEDLVPLIDEATQLLTGAIHVIDGFGRSLGYAHLSAVAMGAALGTITPLGPGLGTAVGALIGLMATMAGESTHNAEAVTKLGLAIAGVDSAAAATKFERLTTSLTTLKSAGFDPGLTAMQAFKQLADDNPAAAQKIIDGMDGSSGATQKYIGVLAESIRKRQDEAAAAGDQAQQNEYLVTTIDDVQSALLKAAGGQLGYEQAVLDVDKAQNDLNVALFEHGENSKEAAEASLRLRQANLGLAEATVGLSDANADLDKRFHGSIESAKAESDKLQQLQRDYPAAAGALQPLIDRVNAYIFTQGSVPESKTTTAYFDTAPADARMAAYRYQLSQLPDTLVTSIFADIFGSGPPKGAKGAIVSRPTLALIGEAGPEAVVPLSRMRGASPLPGGSYGGGGGPQVIQLVVSGRVLAEITAAELSRAGGPQIASRAIA